MSANNIEDLEIHNNHKTPPPKRPRHHDIDEDHHEGEPWLVSYADMMTLLFCFFVIMTSFANFDPVEVTVKSKIVADYINHGDIQEKIDEVERLKEEVASNPELQGIAAATMKDGTLEVVFSSTILFPSGGSEVEGDFYKNIDILIGLIKNRNAEYRIIIEGHTDANDSAKGEGEERLSSWSLSSSRAARVVDRFIFHGFKNNQLVSVGFGDSHPVAPSFDKEGLALEENQALNRRVVIKVLQPLRGAKNKKMNLDNYFENSEIIDQK